MGEGVGTSEKERGCVDSKSVDIVCVRSLHLKS